MNQTVFLKPYNADSRAKIELLHLAATLVEIYIYWRYFSGSEIYFSFNVLIKIKVRKRVKNGVLWYQELITNGFLVRQLTLTFLLLFENNQLSINLTENRHRPLAGARGLGLAVYSSIPSLAGNSGVPFEMSHFLAEY